MTLGLKILCGLYAALMGWFGVRWWFAFDGITEEWAVQSLSVLGTNNLTADMGSLFLGSAIMIALGLRAGQSAWLLATALLMAIAAGGRLVAYATAGYAPESLAALIFEVLSCALLVATHKRMTMRLPVTPSG
jgi:hypothetical protein